MGFILRLISHRDFLRLNFGVPELSRGLCRNRISDRRDAACGVLGNWDKDLFGGLAAHHGRAVCRGELLNGAVLDLAY